MLTRMKLKKFIDEISNTQRILLSVFRTICPLKKWIAKGVRNFECGGSGKIVRVRKSKKLHFAGTAEIR
jgi:hypothetical protein